MNFDTYQNRRLTYSIRGVMIGTNFGGAKQDQYEQR